MGTMLMQTHEDLVTGRCSHMAIFLRYCQFELSLCAIIGYVIKRLTAWRDYGTNAENGSNG